VDQFAVVRPSAKISRSKSIAGKVSVGGTGIATSASVEVSRPESLGDPPRRCAVFPQSRCAWRTGRGLPRTTTSWRTPRATAAVKASSAKRVLRAMNRRCLCRDGSFSASRTAAPAAAPRRQGQRIGEEVTPLALWRTARWAVAPQCGAAWLSGWRREKPSCPGCHPHLATAGRNKQIWSTDGQLRHRQKTGLDEWNQ